MGKVQDTISKLGQRAGLRSSQTDIALLVPEQRPATRGSFPTEPDAVRDYIANLKTTASPTSELIRALQHSNRLVTAPTARLQIIRLFEPVVLTTLRELNSGYTGVGLPYPASAASDFEQATTLLQEMAVAYKVILLDVLRRRGTLARKHRLPVIFQAMKHLADCGLRHAQSYQAWPEKTWRDLNTLYLCAEREQGVDTVLTSKSQPQSIRQLYSQCCAFSACNNAHLPSLQMSQLYQLFGKYSAMVELSDTLSQPASDTIYSVALNSAHAPCPNRYCKYQPEQQVRYFDMAPLLDQLRSSDNAEDDESPGLSGATPLQQADYMQLAKVVSGNSRRQHARSIRQTLLHAETGLKEIHALLHRVTDQPEDVSATTGASRQYGTQWIVENRSKGGIGLKWTGKGDCHINVGELIAHCERDDRDSSIVNWHIGIVRWIRSDGHDGLGCGVETLANYSTAVGTSKTDGEQSARQNNTPAARASSITEALLLNEHPAASRPAMLLVSEKNYRLGESINIDDGGSRRRVRLIENYQVGGIFQCFGFKPDL